MTDDPGQPTIVEEQPAPAQEAEMETTNEVQASQSEVSLTTTQAAAQLDVDARTVRRYITERRLKARQVKSARGQEWQIYQSDLDAFKQERDRAATEGQEAGLTRAEESQALTTTVGIIAAELERRSQALTEAQATIERLALEAGRQAGRNEELEREAARLRERVAHLEQERDQLKAEVKDQGKGPRRIKLLPWQQ
ncbi:helix-turn-helix domain-containing protein [Ktedonobacter racemifer]|uniref:DNA binding domain protein, excisionase family n=1 Tax=Ktedonobacter racemifer DSM 44963 TaxID=485913 RepID=D6U8S3_KTERA|nr:helix-turn-helix domain-containing protein [Ktedonobacter racemifer]EFH79633.1 DNA binding domain protein, excisionase family [Ktedonobacter racemifer DSM 44963]